MAVVLRVHVPMVLQLSLVKGDHLSCPSVPLWALSFLEFCFCPFTWDLQPYSADDKSAFEISAQTPPRFFS
jgi:hypothetical protein